MQDCGSPDPDAWADQRKDETGLLRFTLRYLCSSCGKGPAKD